MRSVTVEFCVLCVLGAAMLGCGSVEEASDYYRFEEDGFDGGPGPGNGGYYGDGISGYADTPAPPWDTWPDTGQPDTQVLDTGQPDTQVADTGQPDTQVADTGQPDTVQPDTAPTDATPSNPTVRPCSVELHYKPSGSATAVALAGEFNGWSTSADPMTDPDGDGTYSVTLQDLAPGDWGYKLVVNNTQWLLDPDNPYTKYVGGELNSNLRMWDCKVPVVNVLQASASVSGTVNVLARFERANGISNPELDASSVIVTVGGVAVTPSIDPVDELVEISVDSLSLGKHSVRIWASDLGGRQIEQAPVYVPLWVESEPFQWTDGPLYFVFTDRFRNGNVANDAQISGVEYPANYQGGDFAGVIQALQEGYLDSLGVRSIWLSPVYDNPNQGFIGADGVHLYTGYHGYWPIAARDVDEHMGTAEELKQLIDTAHQHGIRVMFDLVLNHVHEQHPYWAQHKDWFNGDGSCICGYTCDWNTDAEHCWFTSYMPDLNYRNHAVVQQLVDDTLFFVKEFDIDALRLDAVKHMPHVIGQTISLRIRDALEQFGPRFYLVGETFAGGGDHALISSFIGPHELDGQFDFTLHWTIVDTFARGTNFYDLDNAVKAGENAYGDALMSPFLGNHDVARFTSFAAGGAGDPWYDPPQQPTWDEPYQRIGLGFTFLLTLPGVPLIYYGDEVGLAGGADPDNRRLMPSESSLLDAQRNLRSLIQKVGQLRSQREALRRGSRQTLLVEADVYAYARKTSTDVAIVVLNRSSGWREVWVPTQGLGVDGQTLTDGISGASFAASGGGFTIGLGGWSGAVLVP